MKSEEIKEKLRAALSKEEYEEFHNNHVKMWDWLSKNPNKEKIDYFDKFDDYFDKFDVTSIPFNKCYGCELTALIPTWIQLNAGLMCGICPLTHHCFDNYNSWCDAENEYEASEYAEKIRDISWYNYEDFIERVSETFYTWSDLL